MKRIYIILLLMIALVQHSCNKVLDRQLPPHTLVGENAIVDESTARSALNGAYSFLQYEDLHTTSTGFSPETAFSFDFFANTALMAGLIKGSPRILPFDQSIATFSVNALTSASNLGTFIRTVYRMSNAANHVIHYTALVPDGRINMAARKEIIAEAKFLRGFAHLWFMKMYCHFWDINSPYGPILRLQPSSVSDMIIPRSTVKEGYVSILGDFEACANEGPEKHTSVFKTCRTLARAFKADVLMMRGDGSDYADALALADQVINSHEFTKAASFADVFNPANDYKPSMELMFSRSMSAKLISDFITNNTAATPYSALCEVIDMPSAAYVPSTEPGNYYQQLQPDKRYDKTWGTVTVTSGNPPAAKSGLALLKEWRSNANCPVYIMRLAQMYILKAEALARTNADATAVIAPLNELRVRAGNAPLAAADYPGTSAGRDKLMAAILDEYVMELGMENGSEWFAMVRMKDINGNRMVSKFNIYYKNDNQLCLPLPDTDIASNDGVLIPNP